MNIKTGWRGRLYEDFEVRLIIARQLLQKYSIA